MGKELTLEEIKIDTLMLGKLAAKLAEKVERLERAAAQASKKRNTQAEKVADLKVRVQYRFQFLQ